MWRYRRGGIRVEFGRDGSRGRGRCGAGIRIELGRKGPRGGYRSGDLLCREYPGKVVGICNERYDKDDQKPAGKGQDISFFHT